MECPCGHRAAIVGGRGKKAYQCFAERQSRFLRGTSACSAATFSLPRTEQSVIRSLQNAAEHPEAIAAAVQAYQQPEAGTQNDADAADLRRELAAMDAAVAQIKQEEAGAVQAQISGIGAGASPDAYAAVFAGLAARRKDLEDRRRTVARSLGTQSQKSHKKGGLKEAARRNDAGPARQALRDMARVLSSDAVPGREKRDLVARIIAGSCAGRTGPTSTTCRGPSPPRRHLLTRCSPN